MTLAPEVRLEDAAVDSRGARRKRRSRLADADRSHRTLPIRRYFTTPGPDGQAVDPYDELQWDIRTAVIEGADGKPVFEQRDVEFPATWSQNATNVVASKYFRGPLGTPQRERSVRQLISRVVDTITGWGRDGGYFASAEEAQTFHAELTHILLQQKACFNSPVWFNVGIEEKPQCSACFILSIDDSMDSILEWYRTEGRIFKGGSGSGINLSKLRSSKESMSTGGLASGPVSFMRGADAIAGTIKSGGKTRRAAKMVVLNVDHPDVEEFVWCKAKEERKAYDLGAAGWDVSLDGEAWISVQYQNANNSVRVTDDFMRAVEEDRDWQTRYVTSGEVHSTFRARELMRQIAQAAWECADPGMQYDTTINDWHTCPNTGRINASNPCSEYMHLDDSACNLASLNLMKFLREEQGSRNEGRVGAGLKPAPTAITTSFDVEAYKHAVAVVITAQEIIVSNSSYPTERIARNAVDYRQLGLGYSNLGALLMSLGIPYDSDEGRAYAAALTAIMTGHAYATSARIAARMGPFAGYEKNREPMLGVMRKHRDAAYRIEVEETGTVGAGLKPAPAAITAHIDDKGTIEGAPGLKEEHLPVFDCAFKSPNGSRCIHWLGHIKMMGAVQPFISGAISKTVNLPEEATVEEIEQAYIEGWKYDLKALAIYRDGSKRAQPLSTSKDDPSARPGPVEGRPVRRRLPATRGSITHKFSIEGHEGYITAGLYEDGSPGEIWLTMAKEGSTLSGMMDAFATSISLALQYGVPLRDLVNKFGHMRFEPSGRTENAEIPVAQSIVDYIFRWLASQFLSEDEKEQFGVLSPAVKAKLMAQEYEPPSSAGNGSHGNGTQTDAPPCANCGWIMSRCGTCYRCDNCGTTSGCG
ncbi:MAG: adenosylcobalamin-dependent ribonucleoside-diphosphate reductase [Chloroflexi bacterium]|nr:adenosylcobalamin-dependent ribonucleoside-diphosphate reductase [Chloroflexota bacterium]